MISRIPGIRDLAMTTNGVLLSKQAAALRQAGLGRVTVSLDTLRPERMRELARSDRHADVLAGIDAARAAGFRGLKLNTVVIRGVNDDELVDQSSRPNHEAASGSSIHGRRGSDRVVGGAGGFGA
jgi:cyclic pyranopterin phosphate synthase